MNSAQGLEISSWQAWLIAIRPKTLPAAVSPIPVGTPLAVSRGAFAPLSAVAALAGALLIQIGANLANDYYDYVKGVDIPQRKGPRRVAQSGLIALPRLRLGITATFALAALVGAYLIFVGGWPVLVIGLASLLSALLYTGGPFPIGYHGLGDLFVFLFFGLAAVCGTYYVQALSISPMVIAASIPVGALTVAILVVNNLQDIETDQETGKRTLAVILGARGHTSGVRATAGLGLCRAVAVLVCWVVVSMDVASLAILTPRRSSWAYHLSDRGRPCPEQGPGRDRKSGPCVLRPLCHGSCARNRDMVNLIEASRTQLPGLAGQ